MAYKFINNLVNNMEFLYKQKGNTNKFREKNNIYISQIYIP